MSKTPRTLLENYLDASKTQTVKVTNKHVGLVRTPEMHSSQEQILVKPVISRSPYIPSPQRMQEQYGAAKINKSRTRTPEPYLNSAAKSRPQHDRVSSLRSNRRSISSTNEVEETPRQLLQGFLESEDTTAPLVRYTRRTSQGRLSSSQPALPVSGRRSFQSGPGNWTVDIESDTPRTLLQKYVLNTTAAIETPAPRHVIQQEHTPDVQLQQNAYNTPSPFKTNTEGSDGLDELLMLGRSRGKTPRSAGSRKGKFSISVIDDVDQTVDESVIPPTNPADYKVPSPFFTSSSDEESFVAETTYSSTHQYDRSQHQRGNFNISVPDAIREEILQYQQSQGQYRETFGETRNQTGNLEDERTSDSENEQDFEGLQGTRMVLSENEPGTSMLPDWKEYTMPLKDNEMSTSPVITDIGYRNSFSNEEYEAQGDERRNQDTGRRGRWSEGHKSRLLSPEASNNRPGQLIEGHRRSLPGHMAIHQLYSPKEQNPRHSEMNISPVQQFENGSSLTEIHRRKDTTKSKEVIARMSRGEIDRVVDALSPPVIRSYTEDVDELFTAQKLEYAIRDIRSNQSLSNMSGNFSPRITSTQRTVTVDIDMNKDDRPLPTVTPSPIVSPSASPRSLTPSSNRRSGSRVLTPSQRENLSTSVSPASSSRSMSSRNSSRKSGSRVLTPLLRATPNGGSGRKSSTPLQTVTPSPVVSSGGSHMAESPSSLTLKQSSRISRTTSQIPAQGSVKKDSFREERSRSLQNRSRSEVQTLSDRSSAASPVVASRRLASDMVNTLPNNTANFSPQIASTQNVATLSRVVHNTTEKRREEEITDAPIDDGQWQDEMDTDQGESDRHQAQAQTASSRTDASVKKQNKVQRRPRQKSNYSLPVNVVKKQFTHFAGLRVTKEAVDEVMKVSEKYWDLLARDLEAYAKHAGRKQINMSDFVLLFKRQGHVTEKQSLKALIEKYLPMEEREKLIPVARAGNRIEPKM